MTPGGHETVVLPRQPQHSATAAAGRHAGHGSWDDTAQANLGLSKIDWNNDALCDQLPVR